MSSLSFDGVCHHLLSTENESDFVYESKLNKRVNEIKCY